METIAPSKKLARFAEAPECERAQAETVFETLVELENHYDPKAATLYADEGVVVERLIKGEAEKRRREIPLKRYKKALPLSLLLSKKAGIKVTHSERASELLAPGLVRLQTLRSTTHSRAPAPYQVILRREPDGAWRIVEEIAARIV